MSNNEKSYVFTSETYKCKVKFSYDQLGKQLDEQEKFKEMFSKIPAFRNLMDTKFVAMAMASEKSHAQGKPSNVVLSFMRENAPSEAYVQLCNMNDKQKAGEILDLNDKPVDLATYTFLKAKIMMDIMQQKPTQIGPFFYYAVPAQK